MKIKTLALSAVLTLTSALGFAAVPQLGVYQQMYKDGRLKSVVTVLHNPGTGDYMAMNSMGDWTYLSLDALDNNGIPLEEYATRFTDRDDSYAVSENCFVINGTDLANCNAKNSFKVQAQKKQGPTISCPAEGKIVVSGAGNKYDGEYYFSPRSEVQANSALMLYAYEYTKNPALFEEGKLADSYQIYKDETCCWIGKVDAKYSDGSQGSYTETVLIDNGFNIVMKVNNEGNTSYKPFFVSNKYKEWAQKGLGGYKTWVNGHESSLYMHQYLARTFPELVKDNNAKLVFKDFFGGEGENAIFTRTYDLLRAADGVQVLAAQVGHADNDAMRVKKYMGIHNIIGDEVRVREQPNTNCQVLGYVNTGNLVEVLGLVKENEQDFSYKWACIRQKNGSLAYVATQFVAGLNN